MKLLNLTRGLDAFFDLIQRDDKRVPYHVSCGNVQLSAYYTFIWIANQNKVSKVNTTLSDLRRYLRCTTATLMRTNGVLLKLNLIKVTDMKYTEEKIPERKIFFGLFTIKEKVRKYVSMSDKQLSLTDDGKKLIKKIESLK